MGLLKDLFTIKKPVKSEENKKQELPILSINDIFQTTDKIYKICGKVSPVNGELLSEDDLESVFTAIQGALNSFDGRCGIYIQSQRIDIETNLMNIELKQQELNSELKVEMLEHQKQHLARMTGKSRNVLNFYIVLESQNPKFNQASTILEDSLRSVASELESEGMYVDQMREDEIKHLFYERMNPESSLVEPYQPGWGLDEIAPPLIKIEKDGKHLEVDDRFYRFFCITNYPKTVDQFRWLKKIFRVNGDINIAITMTPKNPNKVMNDLSKAYTEAGRRALDESASKAERMKYQKEQESAEQLMDDLTDENNHLYDTNVTIGISNKSKEQLNTLASALRSAISGSKCKSMEIKYKGLDPYWTTLPLLMNNTITQNYTWNLTSADVASIIPFDSSELMEEKGILQGENVTSNGLIIVDPFNKKKYSNSHQAILAYSGQGKSFYIACDAIRHYPYRDYIMIFDIEGEFHFPVGQRYKFSPSGKVVTNPFHIRNAIIDTDDFEDGKADIGSYLAQKIMDMIVFFRWIVPEMSSFDEALLESDLREAYARTGLTFESTELPDQFPTLSALEEVMEERINDDSYSEKEKNHRINLKASLNPYINGSYASMFNGQTNWNYDNLTVFDISQVSDAVRPPLYDLLLKDVWQFAKSDRSKTKRIYVDEAHEFADPKRPQTLMFISTCVKRGRKYGVSFVTATQNLPDFLSIERYGQAIIDNSYFKLFLPLGETDLPVAKKLYNFSDKEMKILRAKSNSKSTMNKGRGIFIAGSQRVEIQTRASDFELEIIDPDQYEQIYGKKSRYRRRIED